MKTLQYKDSKGNWVTIPILDSGTKFTPGKGLELTEDNVLNVTLDTTVYKVVDSLPEKPAKGDENKIHLVKSGNAEISTIAAQTKDTFDEYLYVEDGWELIGKSQLEIDLSEYSKTYIIDDIKDWYVNSYTGTISDESYSKILATIKNNGHLIIKPTNGINTINIVNSIFMQGTQILMQVSSIGNTNGIINKLPSFSILVNADKTYKVIPNELAEATNIQNGLMSNETIKVFSFLDNTFEGFKTLEGVTPHENEVTLNTVSIATKDSSKVKTTSMTINAATSDTAGVMSAKDKSKLDLLDVYQANEVCRYIEGRGFTIDIESFDINYVADVEEEDELIIIPNWEIVDKIKDRIIELEIENNADSDRLILIKSLLEEFEPGIYLLNTYVSGLFKYWDGYEKVKPEKTSEAYNYFVGAFYKLNDGALWIGSANQALFELKETFDGYTLASTVKEGLMGASDKTYLNRIVENEPITIYINGTNKDIATDPRPGTDVNADPTYNLSIVKNYTSTKITPATLHSELFKRINNNYNFNISVIIRKSQYLPLTIETYTISGDVIQIIGTCYDKVSNIEYLVYLIPIATTDSLYLAMKRVN